MSNADLVKARFPAAECKFCPFEKRYRVRSCKPAKAGKFKYRTLAYGDTPFEAWEQALMNLQLGG